MDTLTHSTKLYLGTFERRFDAKGRISIPSHWLGGRAPSAEFFIAWHEPRANVLLVFPDSYMEDLNSYIETILESDFRAKLKIRKHLRRAMYLQMDPQHRIRLDEKLGAKLKFSDQVTLQGEGKCFIIQDSNEAMGDEDEDYYDNQSDFESLR